LASHLPTSCIGWHGCSSANVTTKD
jgi:hypothetical protein